MKRGRKPKPTALKLAQGNAGHRPLNEQEPKAPAGIPVWPSEIVDEVAQKRWYALLPELEEMGVLTKIDRDAIVAYCLCYSNMVMAKTHMQKKLMVKVGRTKQLDQYLAAFNKAVEQLRKLGTEFGLTPSSRSSMRLPPKDAEESPLAKLMQGSG